jgi:hypothetical protein
MSLCREEVHKKKALIVQAEYALKAYSRLNEPGLQQLNLSRLNAWIDLLRRWQLAQFAMRKKWDRYRQMVGIKFEELDLCPVCHELVVFGELQEQREAALKMLESIVLRKK